MGLSSHRRAHLKAARKEELVENGSGVVDGEAKATDVQEEKIEGTEVAVATEDGGGD